MPLNNKGKDQTAKRNASPKSNQTNQYNILARHVDFAVAALGLFATVMLAIGGAFASFHYVFQMVLFFAAGGLASILTGRLYWRHKLKKRRAVSVLDFAFGAGVTFCCVIGFATFINSIINAKPFRIEAVATLHTDPKTEHAFTRIMVMYGTEHGDTITPINFLALMRITNIQGAADKLEAWTVETSENADGPWITLTNIPTLGTSVYWLDGTQGRLLDMDKTGLDMNDRMLGPREEIGGWALFNCPDITNCPVGFFRVTIRDVVGQTSEYVVDVNSHGDSLSQIQHDELFVLKGGAPADMTIPYYRLWHAN